jgi:excisionase family DNA binding protein
MFSVEIKFRAGDREVSFERFATLFLKELLRSAQTENRPLPAPVIPPTVVRAPVNTDRKELEPRAVGLKQAGLLLGVSQHTVRKHVKLGTIPSVRVGRRVLVPTQAIDDLTRKKV